MALRAPLAVPVEIRDLRNTRDGRKAEPTGRAFRLARAVGEDGIRLERPAPFEIGRPVEVRFALPGDAAALSVMAVVEATDDDEDDAGGRELAFREVHSDAEERIGRYVADRLRLPVRF